MTQQPNNQQPSWDGGEQTSKRVGKSRFVTILFIGLTLILIAVCVFQGLQKNTVVESAGESTVESAVEPADKPQIEAPKTKSPADADMIPIYSGNPGARHSFGGTSSLGGGHHH